jgi:hypothetical protein
MYLNGTTESLELVTGTAGAIHVVANWMDHTASGGDPDSTETIITTAATTVIVAAPGLAATDRQIKELSIRNTSNSASNQITLQKDVSATNYELLKVTLQIGEALFYSETSGGWRVMTSSGQIKQVSSEETVADGFPLPFLKVGTAPEAAGVMYCFAKDSGLPGVWAVGTPGLNGRATDGLAAGDVGCMCPADAAAGAFNYVNRFSINGTVAMGGMLIDILWVNTGLVVTTITAQAISAVAAAARDRNGTTNGLDIMAGLLVTAATTNAGAITNCTMNYTDSLGNTANVATMASFPATAVIGTLVPFQLAAGDAGVRVPESVTLGTSLVTGSVSLILYRIIDLAGAPLANAGQFKDSDTPSAKAGFKIYNRSCMHVVQLPTATTATTVQGLIGITQR